MNCVELAKDLFYKAIMDMGYDELSVAGSQGRVKVIDCLDDNVWLGTLMLAADRTAIFISKLRVFDAVYLASHDTADKIQAVPLEDYSGNELSSSYSQYEVSTDGEHGAAFRYLMVRGGVADSIIVDGDEARLRNLAYGSYRPGEPLDLWVRVYAKPPWRASVAPRRCASARTRWRPPNRRPARRSRPSSPPLP